MSNRRLTEDELALAGSIIAEIRAKLNALSSGDPELLFALRRKVFKELIYDERSRPVARRRLRNAKHREQAGLCAICNLALPLKNSELDRFVASLGYTEENTRLLHHECHIADQAAKSYR